jgi:RNA polymerase sigma-70 factor (ECF subfamily)
MTWLCTIARNTALDALEQDRRIHPKSQIIYLDDQEASARVEGIPDQTEDALGSLIKTETQEEHEHYVERLPALYREVARRRIIDGMKYNEIAECMDLELNTVKTRIRRAKKIIDELRKQDEQEEAIG